MLRSPAYLATCLTTFVLLSPGSSTNGPHWPRSADFWATATVVNITIDDTSSLVAYSGSDTWRSSTEPCTTCLSPSPNLAYAATWHDGTHIIPTFDSDDTGTSTSTTQSPSPSPTISQPANGEDSDDKKGDDDDEKENSGKKGDNDDTKEEGDDGDGGKGKGKATRRGDFQDTIGGIRLKRQDTAVSNPFFVPNLDSDDPGFVDKEVTVQFNFTGSAIYVFAIVPEYAAPANTTPTFMNLTYTLDSQPAGTFLHPGNASTPISTFTPSVAVFQRVGLQTSPHSLTVSVGPDSVFLLDYIVYTAESDFDQSGNASSTTPGVPVNATVPGGTARTSPSPSSNQSTASNSSSRSSSHSVATFAGAIGGSIGLLTVLALSLVFSIYRRRLRARRRDRAYRDARGAASISSFHTDASEDGPPMQGPQPFVPRYFPGTVVTAAPPPYSPSATPSNDLTSALLGPPIPSVSWSSRRTGGVISDSDSYADRPPPTPPNNGSVIGFDIEDAYFAPPPSFPVAIATPVPAILAGLSAVSSPSPAPAATLSPSRPTTPVSPVIPLLPPPPSSRPASLHSVHEQTPGAGPSGAQTPPAPTPLAQPVASSRVSVRSLHAHTSEESTLGADGETNSPSRRSPELNRAGATAPVLICPIFSITDSQGGTGAQGQEYRSEGAADSSAH